jgi:hypothetical protein
MPQGHICTTDADRCRRARLADFQPDAWQEADSSAEANRHGARLSASSRLRGRDPVLGTPPIAGRAIRDILRLIAVTMADLRTVSADSVPPTLRAVTGLVIEDDRPIRLLALRRIAGLHRRRHLQRHRLLPLGRPLAAIRAALVCRKTRQTILPYRRCWCVTPLRVATTGSFSPLQGRVPSDRCKVFFGARGLLAWWKPFGAPSPVGDGGSNGEGEAVAAEQQPIAH